MLGLDHWLDPHVEQYLLVDDDEYIVDEVHKHPMAIFWPAVRTLLGVISLILATYAGAPFGWLFGLLGIALIGQATWKIFDEQMDRFVITNMRAFRVHGLFSRHRATTPMTRILDITVNQSPMGGSSATGTSSSSRPRRTRGCARSTTSGARTSEIVRSRL